MKKVFYIFLAHVLVLGSVWLWKAKDADIQSDRDIFNEGHMVSISLQSDSSGNLILDLLADKELISIFFHENEGLYLQGYLFSQDPGFLGDPDESKAHGWISFQIDERIFWSADRERLVCSEQGGDE